MEWILANFLPPPLLGGWALSKLAEAIDPDLLAKTKLISSVSRVCLCTMLCRKAHLTGSYASIPAAG